MKFGLQEKDYLLLVKLVKTPLNTAGETLWCYGSRARGDHSPFSDLDLMIEPGSAHKPQLQSLIGKISEQLTQSNLPIKIDLVLFSEFAESYKNKYQTEKILF